MSGPLTGIRVIEIAGLGPGPFCGMLLADLGAEVIRIQRMKGAMMVPTDLLNRGRTTLSVDLKSPAGAELIKRLVAQSDVLIEGFRPGVAERLGIGPKPCLAINPALVYGRITGWGQDGPMAQRAGHDINYIALSGALHPIGDAGGPPIIPLNLVADFGGGGMLLAVGVLAAVLHAKISGEGQVVDAAMVDGSALLTTMFHGLMASGMWTTERGSNLLDGGAPFYRCYQTADGGYMSVGAIEPKFYALLIHGLGLDMAELPSQYDQTRWAELRSLFQGVFLSKTRQQWADVFEDIDACVYPVLSLAEAPKHRHNRHRSTFTTAAGCVQPAPAPRFSKTAVELSEPSDANASPTSSILLKLGFSEDEIDGLKAAGTLA
ncbi:MAG: CaiB/BaiF CoA-transferase family protein [Myxococcota bacterium]|nr:CaiB/BaiF CoA-transferase family protein [Myxococcota bacterium]